MLREVSVVYLVICFGGLSCLVVYFVCCGSLLVGGLGVHVVYLVWNCWFLLAWLTSWLRFD